MTTDHRPANGPYGELIVEHMAAIRWYSAGAVIPWEKADPDVQERYREKVRCGRLLVGLGDDTYDPLCVLPSGHGGRCQPEGESYGT